MVYWTCKCVAPFLDSKVLSIVSPDPYRIYTLPKINSCPWKYAGPQKERIIFQPSILQVLLLDGSEIRQSITTWDVYKTLIKNEDTNIPIPLISNGIFTYHLPLKINLLNVFFCSIYLPSMGFIMGYIIIYIYKNLPTSTWKGSRKTTPPPHNGPPEVTEVTAAELSREDEASNSEELASERFVGAAVRGEGKGWEWNTTCGFFVSSSR